MWALLDAIELAHYARASATDSIDTRMRLTAENDRLCPAGRKAPHQWHLHGTGLTSALAVLLVGGSSHRSLFSTCDGRCHIQ